MAINADFPMLSFADANPMLRALQSGREGMRQSLTFPKELLAKELENRKANLMNQIFGVQAKYAEPMTQEELRKAQLFNQYYGPNIESEIALRGAQTGHLGEESKNLAFQRNNPLFMGENTKDLAALQKAGLISPEQVQQIVSGIAQKPLSDVQYKNALVGSLAAKPFTSMPMAEKSQAIAIGKNFGLTGDQVGRLLSQGKTIPDIAEMTGHSRDPSTWGDGPNYAPTSANITKGKELNASRASMNVIDDFVGKNLAPYVGNYQGLSPALIYDSVRNLNPEQRQKAIAASILSLEDVAERARSLNLPLGITQTKEMLHSAYLNSKLPQSLMRSEDFRKANEMVMDVLNKSSKAANEARLGTGFGTMQSEQKPEAKISDRDIEATAKKYGITPDKVRDRLRRQGLL